jgi:thioesterase domain-containing protein
MAQQLMAQGERTGLLLLINAMPPNSKCEKMTFTPLWVLRCACNSWHWFRYICERTPDQRRNLFAYKLRAFRKLISGYFGERSTSVAVAEDEVDLSLYSEEQRRLWNIHLRALDHYHPEAYGHGVTVFRSHLHPLFGSFDPEFGWREFAEGGVTLKVFRGAHASILDEPYVREAAAELRNSLSQAHSQTEVEGASDISCNPKKFVRTSQVVPGKKYFAGEKISS